MRNFQLGDPRLQYAYLGSWRCASLSNGLVNQLPHLPSRLTADRLAGNEREQSVSGVHLLPLLRRWREWAGVERRLAGLASKLGHAQHITTRRITGPLRQFGLQVLDLGFELRDAVDVALRSVLLGLRRVERGLVLLTVAYSRW